MLAGLTIPAPPYAVLSCETMAGKDSPRAFRAAGVTSTSLLITLWRSRIGGEGALALGVPRLPARVMRLLLLMVRDSGECIVDCFVVVNSCEAVKGVWLRRISKRAGKWVDKKKELTRSDSTS